MQYNSYQHINKQLNSIKTLIDSIQDQIKEYTDEQNEYDEINQQQISHDNIELRIDSVKRKMENSLIRKTMMEDDLKQMRIDIKEIIEKMRNLTSFEMDIEHDKKEIIDYLIQSEKTRIEHQMVLHPSSMEQLINELNEKEEQIKHLFDELIENNVDLNEEQFQNDENEDSLIDNVNTINNINNQTDAINTNNVNKRKNLNNNIRINNRNDENEIQWNQKEPLKRIKIHQQSETTVSETINTPNSNIPTAVNPNNTVNSINEIKQQIEQFIPWSIWRLIEQEISAEAQSIIFNSQTDSWMKGKSEFVSKLLNHKNIIVLIHDDDGEYFGCYFDCIHSHQNQCRMFEMVFENSRLRCVCPLQNHSVTLYDNENEILFACDGGSSLLVKKQGFSSSRLFDKNQIDFESKYIVAIQMNETFISKRKI